MMSLWRRSTESYRGLDVRCAPGVHEAALLALRPWLSASSRIVDLASGSGAFVSRLNDAGFPHVTSVERDTAHYAYGPVPCVSVDLDRPFADYLPGPFDAVTAIEIIEHLSSPLAFLGEVRRLLRPGGVALVSTPNVSELTSRVKFLLRGEPRYFDPAQYRFQRHMSPMLPTLAPLLFAEAGLQVVQQSTAGTFDGPLRRATVGALSRSLAALGAGPFLHGECLVILAQA